MEMRRLEKERKEDGIEKKGGKEKKECQKMGSSGKEIREDVEKEIQRKRRIG